MFRWTRLALCAQAAGLRAALEIYGKAFTVTPRTWRRITEKNAQDGFSNDERYLRLAIESGGCHGFLYKFSFEPAKAVDPSEDVLLRASELNSSNSNTEDAPEEEEHQQTTTRDTKESRESASPCVVVDKVSASKLMNAVLDYHSELKGAAFVVVGNELVDQSCACAMSFSLRKHNHNSHAKQSKQQQQHNDRETSSSSRTSAHAAKDRPSGRATAIRR